MNFFSLEHDHYLINLTTSHYTYIIMVKLGAWL